MTDRMGKQAKRATPAPSAARARPATTGRRAASTEPTPASVDMRKLQVNWPQRKQPVNLRLDSDIIDWFRRAGAGYQTRMNAVLRAFVDAQTKRR